MTGNVLITGGLGYIGGRLAAFLHAKGESLRLTSRISERLIPEWAKAFDIMGMDFSSGKLPDGLCDGIDTVIHLAALNAEQSAQDPQRAIQTNIAGTQKLVSAAHDSGVRRFLYLSTAHVYGAPLVGRIDEQTIPKPRHPYAWSHRAAEDIVLAAADFEGVVIRMSNAVGPPQDLNANCWMLVANELCREAVENRTITLRGSGEEKRNFIALNDVCRALHHVMELPSQAVEVQIFNLGGGRAIKVIDLAERIAKLATSLLGERPAVKRAAPTGKSDELTYKIDRLIETGFKTSEDLDEELKATLKLCVAHFGQDGRLFRNV